jgi:methylmalonyl-CoA mutase cobalamin-binding subunit
MSKRARATPVILHPIQVVTRRTGISADVLRMWEKRYAVVTPVRSTNGRRLYSDDDIDRLRLLVQATRTGRAIGQVAALPSGALVALLDEGAPQAPRRAGSRSAEDDTTAVAASAAGDFLDAAIAAIGDFDGVALDLLLRRAIVALSANDFLDAVVVPLVDYLRVRVLDGSVRRAHGHLAHAVLRRVLDHLVATATAPLVSRDLVVGQLGGHAHELDALIAAAAAASDGWRVTYLAPAVPADDIADTLAHVDAQVLVLSVTAASGDRLIPRELRRLRPLLPPRVELLVIGTSADAQRTVLTETGATLLVGLAMLRARLRALRSVASANGAADRSSARPSIRTRR